MQLITTGIDMIEIARIEQSIQSEGFMHRIFSETERMQLKDKKSPQHAAAAFAAKEAFSKALGTGVRGFQMREVELLHNEVGKPYFKFLGKAQEIVSQRRLIFDVSITHTKEYAAAVVIAYEDPTPNIGGKS